MKTQIVISETYYTDFELEGSFQEIKSELIATVEIQGQHNGMQNKPTRPDEYESIILNLIRVKVQSCLDQIRKKYLPISGIAAAQLIERDANQKEQELQIQINDQEHSLYEVKNRIKKLMPDKKRIKARKWVLVCEVFLALTEGYLSYTALRHVNIPTLPALFASISIGIGAGVAAHFLGGYIKTSTSRWQWVLRYAISLLPAIVGFCVLGYLRAAAYNNVINLHVAADQATSGPAGQASGFALSAISILLYWVVLLLSIHYFRTKEERLQEQAYEDASSTLADLEKSIQAKNDEIANVRYEKICQMALAMKKYEYAAHLENQLVNFAQEAAEKYKQKNLRYRTDGCPVFFCQRPQFDFNLFFNNVKSERYETVN